MKRIYLLALLFAATNITTAQSMVENIRTATERRGSPITNPFTYNGVAYFGFNDGSNGTELWRSDGTTAGTYMLRDINQGLNGSSPSNFTVYNGEVYFVAEEFTSGREIWKTDGTSTGTVIVTDVKPGRSNSDPMFLTAFNGSLYFSSLVGGTLLGTSEGFDRRLFRTTGSGQIEVMNMWNSNDDRIQNLIVFENNLYFSGTDGSQSGLWRMTPAGDRTFVQTGNIANLTISGTGLYFRRGTLSTPNDLHRVQGGANTLLKTFDAFSGFSLTNLVDVNGTLMFTANESDANSNLELWKSDGTQAGTVLVKDIRPGTQSSQATSFIAIGSIAYFVANNGTNGIEMWRTDGTDAGTYLLKDLVSGASNGNIASMVFVPDAGFPMGGQLFFSATTEANLWKTDGTDAGTVQVKDFFPGFMASSATGLVAIGNRLLLSATDPVVGREIWISDGTDAGTILLKNSVSEELSAFRDETSGDFSVAHYTHSNGVLYFSAYENVNGREMWKTTPGGAELVKDIYTGTGSGDPQWMQNSNGRIIFQGRDQATGGELWVSGGDAASTQLIKDIRPSNSSFPQRGVTRAGIRYFIANDGVSGYELWRSDGTEAGTFMLRDIRPGSADGQVTNITLAGNNVFFVANDGVNGYELWKTDGTPAGTVMVKDIRAGSLSTFMQYEVNNEIVAVGDLVYFRGLATSANDELYVSDGTEGGTFQLTTEDKNPMHITAAGGKIFFNGRAPGVLTQEELYVYNPLTQLTTRITNCCTTHSETARPTNLIEYNGLLYFTGHTMEGGWEMGVSDGGSVAWFDMIPGPESSNPQSFTKYMNRLYFSMSSREHGVELWRTDGSVNGTELVSDIWPGASGSNPQQLIVANNNLYFIANNGVNDFELWSYNPTVQYSLPAGSAQDSVLIQWKNIVTLQSTNELLATIKQSGAAPIDDNVVVKVTVDPSVQQYNGAAYVQRHYDIEPELDAANATATVILYFTQADFNNYNSANGILGDLPVSPGDASGKAALRVIQYHGQGTQPGNYPGSTVVIDPDDSNIRWNTDGYWEVEFDVTGFSGFYISSVEMTALPVQLVSFDAELQGNSVTLEWKVEQQDGIISYTVERSADASDFSDITSVNANSFDTFTYNAIDYSPLQGTNFYRLRILDQDGSIKYSEVVRIETGSNTGVAVFPVPASTIVNIRLANPNLLNSPAILYDNSGRTIRSFILNSMQVQLDVSKLGNGIYYLKAGTTSVIKIQVVH